MVAIRPARLADEEALATLFRRSALWNEAGRDDLLAHPETLEYALPPQGLASVRVAVEGERVIGFATGVDGDGFVELDDLFVDPDQMRQGVGRALIEDMKAVARDRGVDRIEVTANPNALAFYQEVGFVTVGEARTRFGTAPRMRLTLG